MEWAGFVIGVIGILPTVAVLIERARSVLPVRRVLGLGSRHGVDILVTTSYTGISGVGPPDGPRARRDLVPSGDLAGVAEICALLSRVYPRRPYVITASARRQDDRRRDQVLVGGPVHNRYTAQLVCGSRRDSGEDTRIVFDANERYIRLGDREWGPGIDLRFENDLPQTEYAIIVLSSVSRFGRDQRVVALSGLTTYGTHAAAHFLVYGLAGYARRQRLGRRPAVCILIKAAIVNAQPYDVQPVTHLVIDRTGAWN